MKKRPTVERIMDKIRIEDGCWIYAGALTKKGYAHVRHGGKMRFAHVVMYAHRHGSVPDGLELDHTCRRRACCNPDHLEPVTHMENVRRGETALVARERIMALTADERSERARAAANKRWACPTPAIDKGFV